MIGYVLAAAWLLSRQPDLSDEDVERYARIMGATIDRWALGVPVMLHMSGLYSAAVIGRTYDPPGLRPTGPTGEAPW